jgi:hypothetical protein
MKKKASRSEQRMVKALMPGSAHRRLKSKGLSTASEY